MLRLCIRCNLECQGPRGFLLTCLLCRTHYHHRCHDPPVEDSELIARIGATNANRVDGCLDDWLCHRCSCGEGKARDRITVDRRRQPSKIEIIEIISDDDDIVPITSMAPSGSNTSLQQPSPPLPHRAVSSSSIPRGVSSDSLKRKTSLTPHIDLNGLPKRPKTWHESGAIKAFKRAVASGKAKNTNNEKGQKKTERDKDPIENPLQDALINPIYTDYSRFRTDPSARASSSTLSASTEYPRMPDTSSYPTPRHTSSPTEDEITRTSPHWPTPDHQLRSPSTSISNPRTDIRTPDSIRTPEKPTSVNLSSLITEMRLSGRLEASSGGSESEQLLADRIRRLRASKSRDHYVSENEEHDELNHKDEYVQPEEDTGQREEDEDHSDLESLYGLPADQLISRPPSPSLPPAIDPDPKVGTSLLGKANFQNARGNDIDVQADADMDTAPLTPTSMTSNPYINSHSHAHSSTSKSKSVSQIEHPRRPESSRSLLTPLFLPSNSPSPVPIPIPSASSERQRRHKTPPSASTLTHKDSKLDTISRPPSNSKPTMTETKNKTNSIYPLLPHLHTSEPDMWDRIRIKKAKPVPLEKRSKAKARKRKDGRRGDGFTFVVGEWVRVNRREINSE